jgi:ADP-ribose pyrophosphatase
MSIQHGPWKIHKRNEIYRDPWVRVEQHDVTRPDANLGSYAVVHIKPGVSVLAIDDDENVYLTEEFHYGVGRTTLEVVSGGIDDAETPLGAGRRELQEELGIQATVWQDLGSCDPFTASVVSPVQMFVARGLLFGKAAPEGCEQIRCIKMPFAEAVQGVLSGQITHAPSCLILLRVALMEKLAFKI